MSPFARRDNCHDTAFSNMLKRKLLNNKQSVFEKLRYWRHREFLSEFSIPQHNVNTLIMDKLSSTLPFSVARLGRTESRLCGENFFQKKYSYLTISQAQLNAGIYPVQTKSLDLYAHNYQNALKKCSLIGYWATEYQLPLLSSLIPHTPDPTSICFHHALEPFFHDLPWTSALKSKKVLLVSSFADAAQRNYDYRDKIFNNRLLLPDFELIVVNSPVTNGIKPVTMFSSWQETFSNIVQSIDKIDFDIALVCAGSYSLPLVSHVAMRGQQALHIGGAMQLLFGLFGSRWSPYISYRNLYQEEWLARPFSSRPPVCHSVDFGDYNWYP